MGRLEDLPGRLREAGGSAPVDPERITPQLGRRTSSLKQACQLVDEQRNLMGIYRRHPPQTEARSGSIGAGLP